MTDKQHLTESLLQQMGSMSDDEFNRLSDLVDQMEALHRKGREFRHLLTDLDYSTMRVLFDLFSLELLRRGEGGDHAGV